MVGWEWLKPWPWRLSWAPLGQLPPHHRTGWDGTGAGLRPGRGTPIIFNQHTPFLEKWEKWEIHLLQNILINFVAWKCYSSTLLVSPYFQIITFRYHNPNIPTSAPLEFSHSPRLRGQNQKFPSGPPCMKVSSNGPLLLTLLPLLLNCLLTLICQYCNYCQGEIRFLHFHQFSSEVVQVGQHFELAADNNPTTATGCPRKWKF